MVWADRLADKRHSMDGIMELFGHSEAFGVLEDKSLYEREIHNTSSSISTTDRCPSFSSRPPLYDFTLPLHWSVCCLLHSSSIRTLS
jgi:hypothetical protein